MLLTVYVDDSLLAGPDGSELKTEVSSILKRFPGKQVPPTKVVTESDGSTTVYRDLLGTTLKYNRVRRSMRLSQEGQIDSLLEKYRMRDCRPQATPEVHYDKNENSPLNTTFPVRSLVGGLLFIQTVCRPDISHAVQTVQREVAQPTEQTITRAKRILRYLKHTRYKGIEYTSQIESKFTEVFGKL